MPTHKEVQAEINKVFGSEMSRLPSTQRSIDRAYSRCNFCKEYGHKEDTCKTRAGIYGPYWMNPRR